MASWSFSFQQPQEVRDEAGGFDETDDSGPCRLLHLPCTQLHCKVYPGMSRARLQP